MPSSPTRSSDSKPVMTANGTPARASASATGAAGPSLSSMSSSAASGRSSAHRARASAQELWAIRPLHVTRAEQICATMEQTHLPASSR